MSKNMQSSTKQVIAQPPVQPELQEPSEIQLRKKKMFAFILVTVAVVLIVLAAGIGFYNTPANRLQRQLDLGNKYLEEQNYEQAVIAFEEAIAIDDRCMEAYAGGIEAYLGAGDVDGAQDFYDRTLTMLDGLDENSLAENMDYAVEINLAAEKVYGDDRDRIVQILEEGYTRTGKNEEIKELLIKVYLTDAKDKATNSSYEDALAVYDRLLELDNTNTETINDMCDCLNKYIDILMEAGKYDDALALLEKGYAQTEDERLQAKMEELTNLKAQEEAEKEKLLAEEEAERQRELEKEVEGQGLQVEAEEEGETAEETPEPEQEEEILQEAHESSTAVEYQEKAVEYAIDKWMEELVIDASSPYFLDARWFKTPEEYYEYCSTDWDNGYLYVIGSVNTSMLEETENQCMIKVKILWSYREGYYCDGYIYYYEVIIDKDTELRTIADYYRESVGTYGPYAENKVPQGTVIKRVHPDPSEWDFDPNE